MADIEIVIKMSEEEYSNIEPFLNGKTIKGGFNLFKALEIIKNGIPLPKGHGIKFEEIVVEYPTAELCTYPEHKGKPYFSIKYEENGEHIIGFGTYKPEVLSRYLQEYFIAPTIIEIEADKESEK